MCNLYTMTATVDEMRRVFGPFTGDTANLPPFDEIYPGYQAPVLRREGAHRAGDVAIIGDEAYVERAIARLRDAGATEFIGNAWGFTTPEEHDRTVSLLGALSGAGY